METTSEVQVLEKDTMTLLGKAHLLATSIKDQPSYQQASKFLIDIKTGRKRLKDFFAPSIQKAKASYDEIKGKYESLDEPLAKAEKDELKPAMAGFLLKEENERRLKEEQAQALAKRQAEEATLATALAAEEGGNHADAEAILEEPVMVAPIVLPKVDKGQGISTRDDWKYEILNKRSVIDAVMKGEAPITFIEINETVLGQMVRALKSEFRCPGVRTYIKTTIVGRI